jgi:hypothetical protein
MCGGNIVLGRFSRVELDSIIRGSSRINDAGERIDFLSKLFLGVAYAGSTLIGDKNTTEVFVIDLGGFDCLTFIEYIEAMRLSGSYCDFTGNLKRVRYRSGVVDFMNRNHFLTDWKQFNADFVDDVTDEVGGQKTLRIRKTLNEKEDGTYFLQGVPPVEREILYIPAEAVDDLVCGKLRNGDYIGIYSGIKGLDVSHVGIAIRAEDRLILRHASSQQEYMRVIDQDFRIYVANKPGIVVFRPR